MSADFVSRKRPRSTDPEPGPTMDDFKSATRLFRERDEAVNADEGGFAVGPWVPVLLLLAITAGYVGYEVAWNVGLLRALSDRATDSRELDWIVAEGRWLAAFGLAWAILKSTFFRAASSVSSGVAAAVLVGGAVLLTYSAIGRLYDAAIDALPPEHALRMYKTAVHRTWAVAGDLKTADESTQDPVAVVLWPLKVADGAQASAIERVFDDRAANAATEAAELAHRVWPEVAAKLARAGDPAQVRRDFEQAYAEYRLLSARAKSVFSGWQESRERAMEQFSGLKPNPDASPEAFARMLLTSRYQRHRELGQIYIDTAGGSLDPVVYAQGALQLRGSDFRQVRTEQDFVRMLVAKAAGSVLVNAPTTATVKAMDGAHDVIAAAMVPAMAMALSCLGVLLNAGALVGLLVVRVPVLRHLPQPAIPVVFLAAVLALTPATSTLPGLDGGMEWLRANHAMLSWVLERVITLEHLALAALG